MIIDREGTNFTLSEGLFIDKSDRYKAEFQNIQRKVRLARLAFATEHFPAKELEQSGVHDAIRNNGVFGETLRALFDLIMYRFDDSTDSRELGHPLHTRLSVPELGITFKFALHEFVKAQTLFSQDKGAETIEWIKETSGIRENHPELRDIQDAEPLYDLLSSIDMSDAGQQEIAEMYHRDGMRALGDMATAGMIMRTIATHFDT
jgi:hypothetical protein